MRLNAVHLVNFRQHADTRIEFDLGVTGVVGPNGTGKTTILEAIAWALYGQQAARGTRDSIRFSRAAPRSSVRVELDFELAGHRYRVVRGLTSAELYLDGGSDPIASSISGVSELLQRRLGMTRAEFFHTYFTGQKELAVMAAMQPGERGQFLARVLGYDKLRIAQGLARERRRIIAAEITGVRSQMPEAETVARALEDSLRRVSEAVRRREAAERQHRDADTALRTLTPKWETAQSTRDAMQRLVNELRLAENDELSRRRDQERVDRELGAMTGAKLELAQLASEIAPLSELVGEFRTLEDLAREEGRRQALEEAAKALDEDTGKLRERHAEIARAPQLEADVAERLERKRRDLEIALGEFETRQTGWVRDRQEAETRRDALRNQWGDLKAQRDRILDLGEEGVCPTCTRVLGESFRTVLDQLQEQMETIEVDGKYFNTRLEQLEEMPEDVKALDAERKALSQEVDSLGRQLALSQSAVRELALTVKELATKTHRRDAIRSELAAIPVGYDAARHEMLRQEMARLAPLNERVTRLSALIEREPILQAERSRVLSELESIRAHTRALRETHDATRFSEEAFVALRKEYETAATTASATAIAAAGAQKEEEIARESLHHAEHARDEMERTREAFQRLERDKRLHEELDRAYSDLRTDLNQQLRPELSELASGFLSHLTEGRFAELELDDQYNIVALEDGVPKPVISGGEEDLSNLVLRLAISQMIAERSGQAFSLLVLDEIFGSLDDARRHNVVQLLRRLQDRFEQVILITHIESVRHELDHLILVEYDEQSGAARVRQPAAPPFADVVGDESPLEGLATNVAGPADESAGDWGALGAPPL